jgi:MFS family permease
MTLLSTNRALGLIAVGVLLATSTWFTGTAAAPLLRKIWGLSDVQGSWLTVSVQLGFIAGTFLYAALNLPDVFSPRWVFFISAGMAGLFNAGFTLLSHNLSSALAFRFLTGVTLAGVYPVGMKLVAQWLRSSLGWGLGVMLAALTLGTSFPYLIFALGVNLEWRLLMLSASGFSLVGGMMVLFLPSGPFLRASAPFDPRMAWRVFRDRSFRLQAFGYFGHMWELYAFWSLAAAYLAASFEHSGSALQASVPLVTFAAIGTGVGGCLIGGWVSRRAGERNVALAALVVSGFLCAVSWWLFEQDGRWVVAAVLLWGAVVIADSPQFSALAAGFCPPRYTGTALTIQNGIGFGITVLSIQLTAWLAQSLGWKWAFVFLVVGPLLGAISLFRLKATPKEILRPAGVPE